MNRVSRLLIGRVNLAVFATLVFAEGVAKADGPTTPACLAASDASLAADNEHKLRAERTQLLICASPSCPGDIRRDCLRRVEELNGQIPTIIFGAKDVDGTDLSSVQVTMDDEVLAERLEGTALPIDPGSHTFTFKTSERPAIIKVFLIEQAERDRRESITFGAPATVPLDIRVVDTPPAASRERSQPPPGRALKTQKVLALATGGLGVVGIGIGTAFGIRALSQKSDANIACPNNPCRSQEGVSQWSSAVSSANISTAAFIVGGTAVVAASVLWFTAPTAEGNATVHVGLGPRALEVRGEW